LLDTGAPLLGDLTETEIEAALLGLERKRFVVRDTTYSFGAAQAYRFRRGIGHEVAYGSLSPEQRRFQHVRVAQWLIANQADPRFRAWFAVEGLIAHHLATGGEATQAAAWQVRAEQPPLAAAER
jgi:hypothetical protein